jgi:hypothetical protein
VDIRHQGHGNHSGKVSQNFGGLKIRDGKTEQGAAHTFKGRNPRNRRFPGLPFQISKRKAVLPHGLNKDRGITANYKGIHMIKTAKRNDPGHPL